MELPPELARALDDLSGSISRHTLIAAAGQLSDRYRRNITGPLVAPFVRSRDDAIAYAVYRFPASFAAACACFSHARQHQPDFHPESILDVGAGSGSASWAACVVWPDLKTIKLVDRDAHMIHVGQTLLQHAAALSLRQADWILSDALTPRSDAPSDLVVASYVLGEIPPTYHDRFLEQLWAATAGTLLVIEPGTPAGFAHILEARDRLAAFGGTMVAPCPHTGPCPMANGDWCHFSQRLPRTRAHREAKAGTLSYEDEKFSYVAMSRRPASPTTARVVRHPQNRTGRIALTVCTQNGLQQHLVTRREGDLFRVARHTKWGDSFPAVTDDVDTK